MPAPKGSHRDPPRSKLVALSRQKLAVPPEPAAFIPENARISKAAEFLAEAYMVQNNILPFRTSLDIGTDIVTQHWDIFKRVQVKGQSTDGKSEDTFTFSTRRYEQGIKKAYRPGELDAFVFVHTGLLRFFIVPADEIVDSGRYTITFGPNSHQRWENAWWVLKTTQPVPD